MYLRISRKIYDEILPEKLGGDLYLSHRILEKFFPAAKIIVRTTSTLLQINSSTMTQSTPTTTVRIMLTFCIQYKSSITTCDLYTCQ